MLGRLVDSLGGQSKSADGLERLADPHPTESSPDHRIV